MSDEEKTEVQKAMEKDCILLVTVNEVLSVVKDVLQRRRPGWFDEGGGHLTMKIDTKCRGPICAQYLTHTHRCGL